MSRDLLVQVAYCLDMWIPTTGGKKRDTGNQVERIPVIYRKIFINSSLSCFCNNNNEKSYSKKANTENEYFT